MSLPLMRAALLMAGLALAAGCGSTQKQESARATPPPEPPFKGEVPYAEVGPLDHGCRWFKDASGKYGFFDANGKVTLPAQFTFVGSIGERSLYGPPERGFVKNDKGLYGMVEEGGTLALPCEYTKIANIDMTYFMYMVRPDGTFDLRWRRRLGDKVTLADINSEQERAQQQEKVAGPRSYFTTPKAFLLVADVIDHMPEQDRPDPGVAAALRTNWTGALQWARQNYPGME